MLGLIAVVTGSRELYKPAEPSTVKRVTSSSRTSWRPSWLSSTSWLFSWPYLETPVTRVSDARSKGKGLAPPTSDERGDRSQAYCGHRLQLISHQRHLRRASERAYIEIRKRRQSQTLAFEKFGGRIVALTLYSIIETRGATLSCGRPACAANKVRPPRKSGSLALRRIGPRVVDTNPRR
jgi:hypothetical protein